VEGRRLALLADVLQLLAVFAHAALERRLEVFGSHRLEGRKAERCIPNGQQWIERGLHEQGRSKRGDTIMPPRSPHDVCSIPARNGGASAELQIGDATPCAASGNGTFVTLHLMNADGEFPDP